MAEVAPPVAAATGNEAEAEALADAEGLAEADGVAEALGLTDAVALAGADALAEALAEGLPVPAESDGRAVSRVLVPPVARKLLPDGCGVRAAPMVASGLALAGSPATTRLAGIPGGSGSTPLNTPPAPTARAVALTANRARGTPLFRRLRDAGAARRCDLAACAPRRCEAGSGLCV
ncbi:hypothetical protein ABUW04_22545 [Streptacidiphilus sp. N1-10]|uniref:Uncharacterized protein n=1 Tax=Streptacidiphilus jeojiensis TaxID=3229225 RepID=A0ABV6XS40_9ACTN